MSTGRGSSTTLAVVELLALEAGLVGPSVTDSHPARQTNIPKTGTSSRKCFIPPPGLTYLYIKGVAFECGLDPRFISHVTWLESAIIEPIPLDRAANGVAGG